MNYIKYGETSIITRIFTEDYGLQSYIINGVRTAKSRNKIAFYQPLTFLEMVVYHKKNATLHRISEIKCYEAFQTIPFEVKKSSIALFISEILSKSIQGENDSQLFHFLQQSILMLEHMTTRYENFHLQFLLKLSRFLGFEPLSAEEVFTQVHFHANNNVLAKAEKELLDQLLQSGYENEIKMSQATRRDLLEVLLKFYALHIENLSEIRSVAVLREVMD